MKLRLSVAAATAVALFSQTALHRDQLRDQPTVIAIEWRVCTAGDRPATDPCSAAACSTCPCSTNPAGCQRTSNCGGLELYRFRLSDGSLRGPYVALLAPSELLADLSRWQPQPVISQTGAGTIVAGSQVRRP